MRKTKSLRTTPLTKLIPIHKHPNKRSMPLKLILERKRLHPPKNFARSRRESKNWRKTRLIKRNSHRIMKAVPRFKIST